MARRRANGVLARDSWMRPNRGAERGGKGTQEVGGRLGRGVRGGVGK